MGRVNGASQWGDMGACYVGRLKPFGLRFYGLGQALSTFGVKFLGSVNLQYRSG
ncbi:hypothetical protein ABIE13_002229 [Ottowia thiooxydans]|uniref:Uncharacterized protein n=1 Tax=Ottowia thiooxydans TaxID=219182 RepID=A0ABV2Q7V3_9BURK